MGLGPLMPFHHSSDQIRFYTFYFILL